MSMSSVIANTLKHFKTSRTQMTPEAYVSTFCKFAKAEGMSVDSCDIVPKYKARLNDKYQKLANGYTIKSVDELLYFLIVQLNRLDSDKSSALTKLLLELNHTLLKTITKLHNKEAENLAHKSLDRDLRQVELLKNSKEEWKEFNGSYSHGFFSLLDEHGVFTKSDLPTLIKEVAALLLKGDQKDAKKQKRLIILFNHMLTPSISHNLDDKLEAFASTLKKSPNLLLSEAILEESYSLVKQRIKADNDALKEHIIPINTLVNNLLQTMVGIIESNEGHKETICKIKDTLANINFEKGSLEEIQATLVNVSGNLESDISSFNEEIHQDKEEINKLHTRVEQLEKALSKANQEATQDYLTKALSRRGLNQAINDFEARYKSEKKDFAIIFFDIDHFKHVNDNYGHHAGDVILATVGKLLSNECEKNDIVGRFGGEEFILLKVCNSHKEAYTFTNNIRKKIEASTFVYEKRKLKITISGGISLRSESRSKQDAIELSDSYTYEAKNSGRNRILPKP
jgi:diguanylate cyclase